MKEKRIKEFVDGVRDELRTLLDAGITRRTVNGNLHLANMEVRAYNGLKVVTEFEYDAVIITVYGGENPKPIAREAYGRDSTNLDERTEG